MAMNIKCRRILGIVMAAVALLPAAKAATDQPQAVVNGRFVAVGSDWLRLQQALERTGTQQVAIDIAEVPTSDGRELNIRVIGSPALFAALDGTTVSLVRYIDTVTTPSPGVKTRILSW